MIKTYKKMEFHIMIIMNNALQVAHTFKPKIIFRYLTECLNLGRYNDSTSSIKHCRASPNNMTRSPHELIFTQLDRHQKTKENVDHNLSFVDSSQALNRCFLMDVKYWFSSCHFLLTRSYDDEAFKSFVFALLRTRETFNCHLRFNAAINFLCEKWRWVSNVMAKYKSRR